MHLLYSSVNILYLQLLFLNISSFRCWLVYVLDHERVKSQENVNIS